MAKQAVAVRGVPIKLACQAFVISESCYRYESKQSAENDEIADWLIRLTDNNRNWGFGLCYLYLRKVKGFGWNHKRVYPSTGCWSSTCGSSRARGWCATSPSP